MWERSRTVLSLRGPFPGVRRKAGRQGTALGGSSHIRQLLLAAAQVGTTPYWFPSIVAKTVCSLAQTAAEEARTKTLCSGDKIKFLRPLSCRGGRNAVPGTLEMDGAEIPGTLPSETKDTISEEAGPEEPSSILLASITLTSTLCFYIHCSG